MQAWVKLPIRQSSLRGAQLRRQRCFLLSTQYSTDSRHHTTLNADHLDERNLKKEGRNGGATSKDLKSQKNNPFARARRNVFPETTGDVIIKRHRSVHKWPMSPIMRKANRSRLRWRVKDALPGEKLLSEETANDGMHDIGFRLAPSNTKRERHTRGVETRAVTGERVIDPVKRGRPVKYNKRVKAAPFATRFEMNPFAHALGTPVREDCFTGMHLPNSCLLAFHVVSSGSDAEEQALLPTALAAELIPAKKSISKLTEEEVRLREMWVEECRSPRQVFAGSYILNAQNAVQFVSEDSARRVPSMVISRRIHNNMTENLVSRNMSWRNDMPDFVLSALRKIVVKKVNFFFRSKQNKDMPGLVCALPGDESLERLDDMDEVACVLRLTPGADAEEAEFTDDLEEHNNQIARLQFLSRGDEASTHNISMHVEPEQRLEKFSYASDEQDGAEDVESTPKKHFTTPPASFLDQEGPESVISPQVTLRAQPNTWWQYADPFHRLTLPLPPPLKPMTVHYPSIMYRRRRIPLYGLPELLGDAAAEQLVKGTVFQGVKYVAMAHALGTIQAHVWLLKLQDYLAQEASQVPRNIDD